jgi:hypothetical protein
MRHREAPNTHTRMKLPTLSSLALATALVSAAPCALAQSQPAPTAAQTAEARSLFQQGLRLVEQERWGEALEFFRRSRAIAARPSTVFNIGSVYLRLGRMAEAIATLEEFLQVSDARQNAAERTEAQRLLVEARAARVQFTLSISVSNAQVFVDGTLVEGQGAERSMQLDPGSHVIRVTAEGHDEQSFTISSLPGQAQARPVLLRPRPTRLALTVSPSTARVSLDGTDRGVERELQVSPGQHALALRAEGYLPLDRSVNVALGQTLALDLSLSRRPTQSVFASPWFWTAVGVVVVGTAIGVTIAAVPVRLDPYGGSTGTVISARSDAR